MIKVWIKKLFTRKPKQPHVWIYKTDNGIPLEEAKSVEEYLFG